MLKNLKSLFIVEDENLNQGEKDTKAPKTAGKPAGTSQSKPATPSPGKPPPPSASEINDKIFEKLMAVIEKNNLDGFDYIEYKKSLTALAKMPMDEKTRYMSAFATATTVGATLDKLNSSIVHYKKVLHVENDQFMKATKEQIDQKIGSRQRMVEDLKAGILEKSNLIKKLTEDIAAEQEKINQTNLKINEDQGNIENTRKEFEKTYKQLIAQIDYDASKINEYLV